MRCDMKIKQMAALLCALGLAIPVWAKQTETEQGECFFWSKKDKAETEEETVLSEEIPPRRGNGIDSYEQRNPKRDEDANRPPKPAKEETKAAAVRARIAIFFII